MVPSRREPIDLPSGQNWESKNPCNPVQASCKQDMHVHAQAETARRMQVEYETKVAAIKAEGERRREADVRRRQQRYAALDRLQAAAASQVGNISAFS